MEPVSKKGKLSYNFCLHCNKELNIKIYKEHKRLYYDTDKGIWSQDVALLNHNNEELSDFNSPGVSDYDTDPAIEMLEDQLCNEDLCSEDFNDVNAEAYHIADLATCQNENTNQGTYVI